MKFNSTLLVVLACCQIPAFAEEINTRFGMLSTSEDNILLYKGKPVIPEIQGNNSLSFPSIHRIGDADVVLVQDNGGTGCPAFYQFLTINKNEIHQSAGFGTCSDLINVKKDGNSILVSMPGFRGPAEPQSAKAKAAREKHLYIYKAGIITENGKMIK